MRAAAARAGQRKWQPLDEGVEGGGEGGGGEGGGGEGGGGEGGGGDGGGDGDGGHTAPSAPPVACRPKVRRNAERQVRHITHMELHPGPMGPSVWVM